MSQNAWKVKYTKKCCPFLSDLKVLSIFAHSQKGCAGQGKSQGSQHSRSPALVTLPSSLAKQNHPKGTACDCSCAGVVGVSAPRAFCEPVPAQNPSPGGDKSCLKWCSAPAPSSSCCCCCSWLYCIKKFGATAPFTCVWDWGENN